MILTHGKQLRSDKLLYRGINQQQFENLMSLKVLKPKGEKFSSVFTFNGDFYYDGSMTHGESEKNAITMHQKDSSKYKTSGISTTPHWHRAVFYAMGETNNLGSYILIFEKATLSENAISLVVVKDYVALPQIPEDDEIIIHSPNNLPININCIKSIETIHKAVVWKNNKEYNLKGLSNLLLLCIRLLTFCVASTSKGLLII